MNLLNERESIGSHLIKISNNIEQLSIATAGFRSYNYLKLIFCLFSTLKIPNTVVKTILR